MVVKECLQCSAPYEPVATYHYFCSHSCCGKYNAGKTWDSYFKKLLQKSSERDSLTVDELKDILDTQQGLCALSGVQLTKITGKGVISTNASIDRIHAGGLYSKQNIRLVCHYLNSFRGHVSEGEFQWWCRRVVMKNGAST